MTRSNLIRRTLLALVIGLGLTAGPALAASAAPAVETSVAAAGPVAAKACADAPEPTRPTAGLSGKLFTEPKSATNADPFTNPRVPMSDVYGYSYHWVNYDTGCLPGSGAMASFGTTAGNLGLGGSSAVVGFTHGLLNLVVVPDWLAPLDSVLTSATDAVKEGFWTPWAGLLLLLVGVAVLWAATRSDIPQVVTSSAWAFLALVATTYVMSYPVSSAQAVDGLVQSTVAISAEAAGATAPGEGDIFGPPSPSEETTTGNDAQDALNGMFDKINRNTLYEAWLDGTLGSTSSKVASTYGPDLFRASHLTWDEAATVEKDPQAGKAIIDAKKALWVKTAAAVERTDSAAYQQLTGNNGRWSATGFVMVSVGFIMPFLAAAAVFLVLAYAATRAFVPLAPAIGVIGLLHIAQPWVMSILKNVGRFIILGPLFWVGALVNLAIDSAVLDSSLGWLMKLAICLAVPILLFKLLRPGQSIPGMRGMRRMMRMGAGAMFTRHAVRKGVDDANEKSGGNQGDDDSSNTREPKPYRYSYPKNGPVADTPAPQRTLTATPVPRQLEGAPQSRHAHPAQLEGAGAGQPQLSPARTRELAAAQTGTTGRRHRGVPPTFLTLPTGGSQRQLEGTTDGLDTSAPVSADKALAGGGRHPALAPGEDYRPMQDDGSRTGGARPVLDAGEENLSAPASTTAPPATIMQRSDPLPSGLVEANARTVDGAQVFEIWHPPATASTTRSDDDEEYR